MQEPSSSAIKASSGSFTLRGMDPALRAALDAEAGRLGVSLNSLILQTLRVAMGVAGPDRRYHDLDQLIGVWTKEDREEFDSAVQPFEEIDTALWGDPPTGPR